jgi:hypothetical protein
LFFFIIIAFSPSIYWTDYAQDINVTYTDSYYLNVIGGGGSASSINAFSSSDVNLYNPSLTNTWTSRIWTSVSGSASGVQTFNTSSSGIMLSYLFDYLGGVAN